MKDYGYGYYHDDDYDFGRLVTVKVNNPNPWTVIEGKGTGEAKVGGFTSMEDANAYIGTRKYENGTRWAIEYRPFIETKVRL